MQTSTTEAITQTDTKPTAIQPSTVATINQTHTMPTTVHTLTTKPVVPTSTKPPTIQKLDTSLDPTKTEERDNQTKEAIQRYEDSFGSIDMEKSYSSLFELLWYAQMPCVDVKGITSEAKDEISFIKRCYWKGKLISCNAIFQRRPTDQGTCCSFNMEKAETILKDSKYKEAISHTQSEEARNGFEAGEKPEWYIENGEPIPEVGRDKGLSLIVDSHSDHLSAASISDNSRGFVTIVDDNDKFPLVSLSSIVARPGFESNIKVTALKLQAKDEIRKYAPHLRNCYFPDEYELEIHKFYSQPNCLFECEASFAVECLKTCHEFGQDCDCSRVGLLKDKPINDSKTCVPWFYPVKDEKAGKMCNPWNTRKFQSILKEQMPKNLCTHCLPDCTTTVYDTSISYAELRKCDHTNIGTSLLCDLVNPPVNPPPWLNMAQTEFKLANESLPWYLETFMDNKTTNNMTRFPDQRSQLGEHNANLDVMFPSQVKKNPSYDAFEKDIGLINVFFSDRSILMYVKKNRMSNFDFLSQIGGSIGLAMGISIISFIEIIYWFTIRFCGNILAP